MAPQPDSSPLDPKHLGTGDRLLPSREGVRISGAARCPAIGRHGGMAVGFAAASSLNLSCTLPTCELLSHIAARESLLHMALQLELHISSQLNVVTLGNGSRSWRQEAVSGIPES